MNIGYPFTPPRNTETSAEPYNLRTHYFSDFAIPITPPPVVRTSAENKPSYPRTHYFSDCVIALLVLIIVTGLAGGVALFYYAPSHAYPLFRVEYTSVTLNTSSNGTNPTQIIADWNIEFSVYNPNNYNTIKYKSVSVYVRSPFGRSTVAVLPGFRQHQLSTASKPRMILKANVRSSLPRLKDNNIKFPMDVYFEANLRFLNWLHRGQKLLLVKAECSSTTMGILLDTSQTQGTLLGGPVQCQSMS